jgi:hypothetical protein
MMNYGVLAGTSVKAFCEVGIVPKNRSAGVDSASH